MRWIAAIVLAISMSACVGIEPGGYERSAELPAGETTLTLVQEIGAGTMLARRGTVDSVYTIGYASAVAARGNDVFVVDQSSGKLVRIDLAMGEVRELIMLDDPNTHGVFVTRDLLIYVVDKANRVVRQLDETGRTLRFFAEPDVMHAPVDVALTDWDNAIVVADALNGNLIMFDLLGGAFDTMGADQQRISLASTMHAIAATTKSVYLLDTGLEEVTRVGLGGNPLGIYGEDELSRPSALAVDRCGRLFVADQSGQGIFVSPSDMILPGSRVPGIGTGYERVTDLWLDEDFLYVAAGAEGIRIFRIEPPCPLF
jgi:DNA-binding beta-propeller fold protein YncE